ncbi:MULTISPECIES: GNAT family N-acetyltransferase [Hymenobacter]|uniref:GNAT family N-acetyltransferase n=1 Tax=Hymenobacter TaxID=89966 RepID=UPI0010590C55|nr:MULTISPECIES: GNAT family N-acetyltransferase [Hymenobacter]QIL77501.1 N-acetyltransferase [Hymenobacter sp. HDW8]
MAVSVIHNQEDQSFYATVHGYEAELAYSMPANDTIDFTHTFVDENLRGQGVGEEMARTALAYARDQNLKVLTSCHFVEAFVKRNQAEYKDLLSK